MQLQTYLIWKRALFKLLHLPLPSPFDWSTLLDYHHLHSGTALLTLIFGFQSTNLRNLKMLANPANAVTRELLNDRYGVALPNIKDKKEPIDKVNAHSQYGYQPQLSYVR